MSSSQSFFNKTTKLSVIVIAMLTAGSVYAQNSVALPGVTVSSSQIAPAPTPVPSTSGVTASGWNTSSIIGQGYNVGGDGKGTVTTLADSFFRLGVDANLATNSQGSCKVDCQYTLSRVNLVGEQIAGARSTNQGVGTMSAPVSSVAGTNANFTTSAMINWGYTPQVNTLPPQPAASNNPTRP